MGTLRLWTSLIDSYIRYHHKLLMWLCVIVWAVSFILFLFYPLALFIWVELFALIPYTVMIMRYR